MRVHLAPMGLHIGGKSRVWALFFLLKIADLKNHLAIYSNVFFDFFIIP